MPLPVEPKLQQESTIYGIGGLNTSVEGEIVGTERMAELINFDLHLNDGAATRRVSENTVYDLSTGTRATVTMVIDHEGQIYAGDSMGELFRNGQSIDTGYGETITAENYVNTDDLPILYLASDKKMQKIQDGDLSSWGLQAPIEGPTLSRVTGGLAAGVYQYAYTYVQKIGSVVIQESSPSPIHSTVELTGVSNIDVDIPAATLSNVTHYRLYRSLADGSTLFFEEEFAHTGQDISYLSSKGDTALGTQISLDNDLPINSNIFAVFQDRGWLSDGINVFYSKKFNLNAWPQLNFVTIGTLTDPVVSIVSSPSGLAVFTKNLRYRIMESIEGINAIGNQLPFFGGSSTSFIPILSSRVRGTLGLKSAVEVQDGVLYAATDGLYVTDLSSADIEISGDIKGLFQNKTIGDINPIFRENRSSLIVSHYESKIYVSYSSVMASNDNDTTLILSRKNNKWYSYNIGMASFHESVVNKRFLAGNNDNEVIDIDNYQSPGMTSITATMRTEELNFGAPFIKKVLTYIYVDSDLATGETLSGTLYIDDILNRTFTVSDSSKVRFPPGMFGTTFAVKLSYTGTRDLKIRGVRFIWVPMRMG